MVMQPTGVFMVGGSNPGQLILMPPPPLKSADQDSNHRPKTLRQLHYRSTGGGVKALSFPTG